MAGPVPALSLGRLSSVQRCHRFLATLLDPETKPRPVAKGAFRLDSAVREAIRVAHEVADQQGITVIDTIDDRPPPGLSAEERHRFTQAVQTYAEFVGDDLVSLHPTAGEFLERHSRTGRFRLTGRNDTTVTGRVTKTLEIRRVHLGSRRVTSASMDDDRESESDAGSPTALAPLPIDGDALLTLLVTKGSPTETDVLARVRHLWLGAAAGESAIDITAAMVGAAAQRLTAHVEAALADPTETPGWWCDSCPAIRSCRAVSSPTDQDLATRLSSTPGSTDS